MQNSLRGREGAGKAPFGDMFPVARLILFCDYKTVGGVNMVKLDNASGDNFFS